MAPESTPTPTPTPGLAVDPVDVGIDPQHSAARPIRRVLVANRGEIARRVIRTVHAMGLQAVAIHSDPDADAPFVRDPVDAETLHPLSSMTFRRVLAERSFQPGGPRHETGPDHYTANAPTNSRPPDMRSSGMAPLCRLIRSLAGRPGTAWRRALIPASLTTDRRLAN